MGRIDYNWEPDDTASFLRSCAFSANMARAVKGKRGLNFFRELEAALLALPEKRLADGVMAQKSESGSGEVCALGCVVLNRNQAAGIPADLVVDRMAKEYDPEDYYGWDLIERASLELKISMPLAYAVVEENDEMGARETPEARYERMLKWVQGKIAVSEQNKQEGQI